MSFFSEQELNYFYDSNIESALNLGSGKLQPIINQYYDLTSINKSIVLMNIDILKIPLSSTPSFLDEEIFLFDVSENFSTYDESIKYQLNELAKDVLVHDENPKKYKIALDGFKNGNLNYQEKDIVEFLRSNNNKYDLIILSQILSRMWEKKSTKSTADYDYKEGVEHNFERIKDVIDSAYASVNNNGLIYLKLNNQDHLDQFREDHIELIKSKFNKLIEFEPKNDQKVIIIKKTTY